MQRFGIGVGRNQLPAISKLMRQIYDGESRFGRILLRLKLISTHVQNHATVYPRLFQPTENIIDRLDW